MLKQRELTRQLLGAFYDVYNGLGYGFLEKVYENALLLELNRREIEAQAQTPIDVNFQGVVVGRYFADIVVADQIIVELKVAEEIVDAHTALLLNYLKTTHCEIGFVLDFGPKPDFKRMIVSNRNKRHLVKYPRESA